MNLIKQIAPGPVSVNHSAILFYSLIHKNFTYKLYLFLKTKASSFNMQRKNIFSVKNKRTGELS